MALTIDDVKKNVAYKKIPILTLDQRYHVLFPEKNKTPRIKQLEKNLNEKMKRQGQVNNDLKAVKKLKSQLMDSIIRNADNDSISESKRQKLMNNSQRLIIEADEKIDKLEKEQMDIPYQIRDANIELAIECVEVCYERIHQNYEDIQVLGKDINDMRLEIKKKVLVKQDKETENTEIYTYMHDILGHEMMEVFDDNHNGELNTQNLKNTKKTTRGDDKND